MKKDYVYCYCFCLDVSHFHKGNGQLEGPHTFITWPFLAFLILSSFSSFWTVVLEKTLESLLDCKEIKPVNPKGSWSWIFIGRIDAEVETPNTLATWCKELTHWKRPWCWEGLGAGGEGDNRGWDGWMASLIWWAWVWVNSRSLWWTGRPGVLQFMGSQRVGHDWATELNW